MYTEPVAWHRLGASIATCAATHVNRQVAAGAADGEDGRKGIGGGDTD
jgi:hypothetical protein